VSQQTLASIGSGPAYGAWQSVLRSKGIMSGQILVTHREIDDELEGGTLRRAMRANLFADVVSIVNENDVLSDVELRRLAYGGDNDGLAAHIAITLNAKHLCLLTDTDGLMNGSDVIPQVTSYNADMAMDLAGSGNYSGREGMKTKVSAALSAARLGITAHIADSSSDLTAVLSGQAGTLFPNQLHSVV
jgi:glutamate 5-kinase